MARLRRRFQRLLDSPTASSASLSIEDQWRLHEGLEPSVSDAEFKDFYDRCALRWTHEGPELRRLITAMEHNATRRPLATATRRGHHNLRVSGLAKPFDPAAFVDLVFEIAAELPGPAATWCYGRSGHGSAGMRCGYEIDDD